MCSWAVHVRNFSVFERSLRPARTKVLTHSQSHSGVLTVFALPSPPITVNFHAQMGQEA